MLSGVPPSRQVLPIYGDEAGNDVNDLKWFEQLEAWTNEKSGAPPGTHPFPSVDAALRDLSKIPLVGRMRARRMMAIAALARAIPAYRDRSKNKGKLAQRALRVEGLVEVRQVRITARSCSPTTPRTPSSRPISGGTNTWCRAPPPLIGEKPAFIGHRPCTSGLVRVPVAVPGQGTSLRHGLRGRSSRPTPSSSTGPSGSSTRGTWPGCNGFWCAMATSSRPCRPACAASTRS